MLSFRFEKLIEAFFLSRSVLPIKVPSPKPDLALKTALLEETRLQLKTALSSIEDIDYAEAVTEMKKQFIALEAAQCSFAHISRLSLIDYINR